MDVATGSAPKDEGATPLRVLFAFGVTEAFFGAERSSVSSVAEALTRGFADLEQRFGVRVLGTLDDDETMVGATATWPWTCYVLAEAPSRAAVAAVCNILREEAVDDDRLWKYVKVEARLGRPLFFGEPR